MSKPMDVSPSRPDCALLTRSSKKSSFISPPRVWPAGRGSVLHEPCTPGHDEPPWHASRRCDEQQGGAGGIAKCRCLCFRAAAACTPPSRGQPRLDFEVWQDDRLARPGRAGWGRLNGAKRAQSSSTCPIGLAQAANPRAASLPTRARWRLEARRRRGSALRVVSEICRASRANHGRAARTTCRWVAAAPQRGHAPPPRLERLSII